MQDNNGSNDGSPKTSKLEAFRGRAQREQQVVQANNEQRFGQLQQLVLTNLKKQFELEQRIGQIGALARMADWRSLAILRLLQQQGVTTEQIEAMQEQLQVEDFEKRSDEDDATRKLTNADSEAAANGHTAILSFKVYKNGVELKEERMVRSKINIGQGEFLPEIDAQVLGMKVGETKTFPLNIQEKTDQAEVTLIGLRSVPVETAAEPQS